RRKRRSRPEKDFLRKGSYRSVMSNSPNRQWLKPRARLTKQNGNSPSRINWSRAPKQNSNSIALSPRCPVQSSEHIRLQTRYSVIRDRVDGQSHRPRKLRTSSPPRLRDSCP